MVLKYNKVLKIVNTEFIIVIFISYINITSIISIMEIVWNVFSVIRNSRHMKKWNFIDSCQNMEGSINRL